MLEQLLGNPLFFFSGLLTWIPLAIWIFALIGWMITADIDVISGVVGIFLAFVIGYLAINPPIPMLPPVLLILSLSTVIFTPIVQFAMNRAELRSIDVEAVEKAYDLLLERPNNEGAKLRLAKSLYSLGYVAHAVDIADNALSQVDKRVFREELHVLNKWKQHLVSPRIPPLREVSCVRCGMPSMPHAIFCPRCGSRFLEDYVRGKFVTPGLKARLVALWLLATVTMLAIPLMASVLPPIAAIIGIIAVTIGGIVMSVVVWNRVGRTG